MTHVHRCLLPDGQACASRGYCLCECGATHPAMGDGRWEMPAGNSKELPKALALRLDSRMAIMLNLLACAGCELVSENYESAALVTRHVRRFGVVHPQVREKLLAAISRLMEAVPDEVLEAEGMTRYSSNELRYKAKFP